MDGNEHLITRAYEIHKLVHKMRGQWAYRRSGFNAEDFTAMVNHNKEQTQKQKSRMLYLGGSAGIVQAVMVQNDPSFTTMTIKLLKMVTGCETSKLPRTARTTDRHYVIDVEAMVGDPLNVDKDQEVTLILHSYGFTDLHPEFLFLINLRAAKFS